MKKLSLYVLVAFAGALTFLTSCGGEDPEVFDVPSILLDNTSFTGMPGDVATISGTITAPGGLNVYRVTVEVDGVAGDPQEFPRGSTIETTAQFNFTYTLVEEQVDVPVRIVITATDEANQTGTASFDVTTEASPNPINEDQMVLFGGPANNTEPSFYDAVMQTTYTLANAQANSGSIDVVYYYGDQNDNSLAAPSNTDMQAVFNILGDPLNFTTENATAFGATSLSAMDFTNVSNEDELLASANFDVLAETQVTNLAVDDVIAFRLDAARGSLVGLIHIASIDDTTGFGTITINVKIQQGS